MTRLPGRPFPSIAPPKCRHQTPSTSCGQSDPYGVCYVDCVQAL
jgi:hypothetical protein